MICKNCGAEIFEGQRFCGSCGTAVPAPEAVPEKTEVLMPEEAAAPVAPAEPVMPAPAEPVVVAPAEPVVAAPAESAPVTPAAPVEQVIPLAGYETAAVANAAAPAPKKKKGLKIMAIILAVAVAIGGCVAIFWDKIEKTIVDHSSPERQLQYTYAQAAEKMSGRIFGMVNTALDAYLGDATTEGTITLSADKGLMKTVLMIGLDNAEAAQALSNVNEISIDYKIEGQITGVVRVYLKARVGDTELMALDVRADVQSGKMSASLPGLTDEILESDISALESDGYIYNQISPDYDYDYDYDYGYDYDYDYDYDDYYDYGDEISYYGATAVRPTAYATAPSMSGSGVLGDVEQVEALKRLIPDSEMLTDIITETVEDALDAMSGVTNDDEEFTAAGVSQTAKCLKAEVTMGVVADMAVAALESLKDNGDIEDYIDDVAGEIGALSGYELEMSGDAIYSMYTEAMNEIIDEIKDIDDDEVLFVLKTWVDSNYDIIAIELLPEDTDASIFIGKAVNGGDAGIEIRAFAEGEEMFSIGGKGTDNGGKFSGKITMDFSSQLFLPAVYTESIDYIELIDYSFTDGGTMVIVPSDTLLRELRSEIGYNLSGYAIKLVTTNEKIAIAVVDSDDYDAEYVKLSMETRITGASHPELQNGTVSDPDEWAESIDIDEIERRIVSIFGISIDELEYLFN